LVPTGLDNTLIDTIGDRYQRGAKTRKAILAKLKASASYLRQATKQTVDVISIIAMLMIDAVTEAAEFNGSGMTRFKK
jgi:hypothetical protein